MLKLELNHVSKKGHSKTRPDRTVGLSHIQQKAWKLRDMVLTRMRDIT